MFPYTKGWSEKMRWFYIVPIEKFSLFLSRIRENLDRDIEREFSEVISIFYKNIFENIKMSASKGNFKSPRSSWSKYHVN